MRTTSVDTGLPRSAQWIPASLDPLVLAAAEQDACTDETACHDTGVLATVPSLQRLPDSRIELSGVIGSGATAFVFRGRHVDLDRPLAVKVQRTNLTWPGAHERFLAEARITSELDSPFVVEVVDFGELEDGRLWSAMEFLEGRSLADTLEQGKLSPARSIALLRMACKGLHAAHLAGIVHRDVKPDNLMLVTRRGREHLVIVDFGVATSDGLNEEECCGTPRYMAPEQIRKAPIDGRADLYALGCCAYEMLTGRYVTRGASVDAVLRDHLLGVRPTFPPDAGIPRALQHVIERCLAPEPDDRYASAADLEAALVEAQIAADLHCTSDALEPPEIEDPARQRRLVRRLARPPRRARVRSVGALLAGLLAFSVVSVAWAGHDVDRLEPWGGPVQGVARAEAALLRANLR